MEFLMELLEISGLLEEDIVFWKILIEKLLIVLLIVSALCPRRPKYRSEKRIDKNGNEVIITYELRK